MLKNFRICSTSEVERICQRYLLDKYKFQSGNILNLDETGVMTVIQAPNVVARKYSKKVVQVVLGEGDTLVTIVSNITAAGEHNSSSIYISPNRNPGQPNVW